MYCNFLKKNNEQLYNTSQQVDQLVFVNAPSALVQARVFVEALVNMLMREEKLDDYNMGLKQKIEKLSRKEVFKDGVFSGMDFIRVKGNKAAHEGIDVSLLDALHAHRLVYRLGRWYVTKYLVKEIEVPEYEDPKPKQTSIDPEDIQKMISEKLAAFKNITPLAEDKQNIVKEEKISLEELPAGESYLVKEINRLKASSREALENPGEFSAFKKYMHVKRKIQEDLEKKLEKDKGKDKSLILLVGSVGDGKSHLLSYLQEETSILDSYTIINDATESEDPSKDSIQTLVSKLKTFKDDSTENEKMIVAINLGVLNNFIHKEDVLGSYSQIVNFVNENGIFNEDANLHEENDWISTFNFSAHQPFTLSEEGLHAKYFEKITYKIADSNNENPFYLAYKKDMELGLNTMVHVNYEIIMNKDIQSNIAKLISKIILKNKVVVSTRAYLNFLSDILIPDDLSIEELKIEKLTEFERLKYSLFYLLFERENRSSILKSIAVLDPINFRTDEFDKIMNRLYNSNDFNGLLLETIGDNRHITKLFDSFSGYFVSSNVVSEDSRQSELSDEQLNLVSANILRASYLLSEITIQEDEVFRQYIRFLYGYNRQTPSGVNDIIKFIKSVIVRWKGSPIRDFVYINKLTDNYRVAQKLFMKPKRNTKKANVNTELEAFNRTITLFFESNVENVPNDISLEIDYTLFSTMFKVNMGYRPNNQDSEDCLTFLKFINELLRCSPGQAEFIIHHHENKNLYKLTKGYIDEISFERI